MRLISQNKEFDVPYDKVAVFICVSDNEEIIAYGDSETWEMGSYPNRETALKVMEMLRKAYKDFVIESKRDRVFMIDPIFEFPAADEVET